MLHNCAGNAAAEQPRAAGVFVQPGVQDKPGGKVA
jgi:hypothetical protein